jgi:hypothetical protein
VIAVLGLKGSRSMVPGPVTKPVRSSARPGRHGLGRRNGGFRDLVAVQRRRCPGAVRRCAVAAHSRACLSRSGLARRRLRGRRLSGPLLMLALPRTASEH